MFQAEREHSDPADASSGAVVKTENTEPPNYGEFYNAVGKVFTNHQGSNQQLIQQLGASQRCIFTPHPPSTATKSTQISIANK